jgi:hypothetical protein
MMPSILRRARVALTATVIAIVTAIAPAEAAPGPGGSAPPDTASQVAAARDSALARAGLVEHPPGVRADLAQHASLAFASGLAVGLVTEEPAAAAATSISLGLIKEWLDPRFDRGDLIADLLGAALAAWATHALKP